ncbi:MAG TPA: NrfD/PsrC family molybdoenzyme membrane anchor subunit, partial [Dehalococcoidia bacterium]|nr:NrfD/PsrC family molybdoenzyme membrane anchor subunit [Dehalococcoidia bacterium]
VLIIPLAVSVHTVLAWVFSMTLRPGWNSTAFGPYFVAGAVFSGIAAVVLAMGFFRRLFHLEEYLTPKHFRYVGYLLLTLNIVYIYFTFGEYLTMMYKLAGEEKELLQALFTGREAPLFWSFIFGGLIMPALLVALPWTRTILGIEVASVLVLAGMWLKRFLIVVPSLQVPLMPLEFGRYVPTWVEWSIMLGSVSAFLLLYGIIGRLFPLISIWEMVGEQETAPAEAAVQARRLMFPQPAFEGPRAVASGEE